MYLVKEIADLLGVSDTLVRTTIKELGLSFAKESAGGRYKQITNDDVILIYDYITLKWKDGRRKQAKKRLIEGGIVFEPENETSNQPNDTAGKQAEIALLNAIIADLKADKEQLQKQVDQLTMLLNQQQQLNLATQKQLEYQKSKTFWQRLFDR